MKLKYAFKTFEEAMDIHTKMFERLREQGYVSCSQFIKLIHGIDDSFNDGKYIDIKYDQYGWNNLQDLKVEEHDNEWWVIAPEMVELTQEKENE